MGAPKIVTPITKSDLYFLTPNINCGFIEIRFFIDLFELNNNTFFSIKQSKTPGADVDFTVEQQNSEPLGRYNINYKLKALSYENINADYQVAFGREAFHVELKKQEFNCQQQAGSIGPLLLTCDVPYDADTRNPLLPFSIENRIFSNIGSEQIQTVLINNG